MKFVVLSPGTSTGGPFALSQLHDAILKFGYESEIAFYESGDLSMDGEEAHISYPNDFVAPTMAGVEPKLCTKFSKTDVMVLPEILMENVIPFLNRGFTKVAFWWLSWNNAPIQNIERLDYVRALSRTRHFFQSDYAKQKVEECGYRGLMLSDYTLMHEEPASFDANRKYDFCYFGRKAVGAGSVIERLASRFRVVKIENMSQDEVIAVLKQTRFFLDFGMQPGKDRIPREAIVYGCIPIVRRVGAAKNPKDVPLPSILLPTTSQMLDAEFLGNLAVEIRSQFPSIQTELEAYRQQIFGERDRFFTEAEAFVRQFVEAG